MDFEIKRKLEKLAAALIAKGCCNVSVYAMIYAENEFPYLTLSYKNSPDGERVLKVFSETFEKNLILADVYIHDFPDQSVRERTEFYQLVSKAAAYGRSIGLDNTLINPLEEMAKSLSTNIIAAKPDDEIPF